MRSPDSEPAAATLTARPRHSAPAAKEAPLPSGQEESSIVPSLTLSQRARPFTECTRGGCHDRDSHSGAHGDPHRQEHRGWSVRQRQARRPGAGTRELADPPPPWWPRGGGPRLWRGGQGKPPEAAPAVSRRVALSGRGPTRCSCPGRSRHRLLHLSASAAGSAALPEGRARSMAAGLVRAPRP